MIRLTFLFVFVSTMVYGQTENVFLTRKLKKGIFFTYQQFKTNSPAETEDFTIKPGSEGYFYIPSTFVNVAQVFPNKTGSDTTELMFRLYDSRKKNKQIKNAYAFSDGEHVYINTAMYQNHSDYYLKVLDMGRIIYMRDPIMNQATGVGTGLFVGGVVGGAIGYLSANKESRGVIIFSEDDGTPYILNKKTLTSILLNHDPELYKQYQQEQDMGDEAVMEKYVLLFNQLHP